jgi:hypothetical protein
VLGRSGAYRNSIGITNGYSSGDRRRGLPVCIGQFADGDRRAAGDQVAGSNITSCGILRTSC